MTNPAYISEAWLTFLMKGAYALAAGLAWHHLPLKSYLKDLLSTCAGALTYAVLYLCKTFLTAMIVNGVTAPAAVIAAGAKIPATVFNMAVAIIIAPVLAQAIRKALDQNHIKLN